MIKRRMIVLIPLILAVFLSGCSAPQFISAVDSLLRPPRLTDDQNDIYSALTTYLSDKEMRLVYPQKGDYLSAFIRNDLDGDGENEAIVFYQPSVSSSASPIDMAVLDFQDDSWAVLSNVELSGSGVDDVYFPIENGEMLIALGLSYAGDSGSNLLQVYSLSGGELRLAFSHSYQAKAIDDLTGDGNMDILLVYPEEDEEGVQSVSAGLFSYRESIAEGRDCFSNYASCSVNSSITRYQQVTIYFGKIIDETFAARIYLDGYRGSLMITEELVLKTYKGNTTIRNTTWDPENEGNYPERTALTSMDIDGDGKIEIPGQTYLPGYTEDSEDILYETVWYKHVGARYVKGYTGFVGSQLGYMFLFPENWEGNVTAFRSSSSTSSVEIIFAVYESGKEPSELISQALFSIRAIKALDWNGGKDFSEYEYIASRGQVVFLARLYGNTSEYAVTIDEIRERFVDIKD